jgi:isopenicillin N synthase-like dioxygenase
VGAVEDGQCPCPSHADPGVITIVAEGTAALEVRSASDGAWRRLFLRPNEVAVLTGLQLAAHTGGDFTACSHRVAPTTEPRVSIVLEVAWRSAADAPPDPRSRIAHRLWDPRGGFSR